MNEKSTYSTVLCKKKRKYEEFREGGGVPKKPFPTILDRWHHRVITLRLIYGIQACPHREPW